ncbi:MAG: dephospho-CoA kinase [Actinomycetales bacterium]|nr:dephospho-CoA kinase [Actinomycetales bacterium]
MSELATARDLATTRAPSCGSTRIIGIDGRSGAGKTHFAAQLAHELDCPAISLEHVYPGWHGLAAGIEAAHAMLTHLAHDVPARLPQWDWLADQAAPAVTVEPRHTIVLEGVGAGATALRPFLSALVWVELPSADRFARAIARDGETYAGWWDVWAEQEDVYLVSDRPKEHADLIV